LKHLVLAVFDSKMGQFLPPFTAVALGQASRMFEDAVCSEGSPFKRHPEDYRLFHLGYWDDVTGLFENIEHGQFLREGTDCVPSVARG